MSRFVDSNATRTIPIGPCECPGTPHEQDEVVIHERLGYGPLLYIGVAPTDEEGSMRMMIQTIISWNLLGADGKPMPANRESIELLDGTTAGVIERAINAVVSETSPALPNGSGAASAATSAGNTSPAHSNRRTRRSTKPSSSSAAAGASAS